MKRTDKLKFGDKVLVKTGKRKIEIGFIWKVRKRKILIALEDGYYVEVDPLFRGITWKLLQEKWLGDKLFKNTKTNKEATKKELKELKTAEECLKRAIKEKDKKHRDSLMFQFCLQMARFCKKMEKEAKEELKPHFRKYEKLFTAFAKLYQIKKRGERK